MMNSKAKALLAILTIAFLSACAGPLKVVPIQPVALPDNFIQQGATQDLDAQLQQKEPKYILNFPEGVELSKAFYAVQDGRLFIPAKSHDQFEYMAVDLASGQILWELKLPKKANLYRLNRTASGDLWMDVYYNGSTLVFLDPDSGQEKWRYGNGALEKHPTPFKYFQTDKYNVFLGGNSIFVQDPATYEIISQSERYATDLQGSNVFKGSTFNFAPFYNTKVINFEDQFIVLDHGMHAYSKQTGQKLWSTRFPTIATQFHTGENVGRMIAGAFLGALSGVYVGGNRTPDVMHPDPLVVQRGPYYYVSALNNLYCVNKTTGSMNWAQDLNLGYGNLLAAYEDRLYLISVGDYANGICSFQEESGKIIPCQGALATKNVEALPLTPEAVANLKESDVWVKNSVCYDAAVAKTKLTAGDQQLLAAVSLPTKFAILASDGIHFLNKADGMPAGSLENPDEADLKFQRIVLLSPNALLAVSKRKITCIDSDTLAPSWSLDMPWTLDNLDRFYINSISEKYLYVRAIVDQTIKGCVVDKQTGAAIKNLDGSQSLYAPNFLALQNDKRVSIYSVSP